MAFEKKLWTIKQNYFEHLCVTLLLNYLESSTPENGWNVYDFLDSSISALMQPIEFIYFHCSKQMMTDRLDMTLAVDRAVKHQHKQNKTINVSLKFTIVYIIYGWPCITNELTLVLFLAYNLLGILKTFALLFIHRLQCGVFIYLV